MVRRKRLLRSGCSNDVERSLKSEMRRDARRAAGRVRPNTQHEVNNAICVVLERCSEYEARNDENYKIREKHRKRSINALDDARRFQLTTHRSRKLDSKVVLEPDFPISFKNTIFLCDIGLTVEAAHASERAG